MKKKLLAMLMAGLVAVSVCACGSKDAEDAANTADEAGTQTAEETATTQETEIIRVSEREDYVALEDLATDEYVTLPDYTAMTVQAVKPDVTDERIESYINNNILTTYAVTDRAVAAGDAVKIDYVGKKDDVAFEGGTEEDYVLNIGSGKFIEGFEDGLIGVMPGETVDLNLTFPEEYQVAELAGADVVFTVTVDEIQESTEYANVTPEQLELMGLSYTSKEEIWEEAKKSVEENAEASYQSNVYSAIFEKLYEESKFTSVPEHLVEEEIQNQNIYLETLSTNFYGLDSETFIREYYGMTVDEYNTQLRTMCEETVKLYLILEGVARAEGIEVTDEMMNEKAAEEAALYQYESAEALIEEVGRTTYRMVMLQDMVMEKLMNIVTVEMITEEEAMAETATATAE